VDPKDERVPGKGGIIQDQALTREIPGVTLPKEVRDNPEKYYVQWHTTRDGRTFYEVYERGKPLPDGTQPADPVKVTIEGPVNPAQAEQYEKDQTKAAETAAKPPHTQNINGRLMGYNPATGKFDIDHGPAGSPPTPRTPDQQATDAAQAQTAQATAQTAQAAANERSFNTSVGRGNLTHAEYEDQLNKREAAARAEAAAALAAGNAERQNRAQEAQNEIARERLQLDKDKANQPKVDVQREVRNGQPYTIITRIAADGSKIDSEIRGPDNRVVTELPVEGRTSLPAGMPPLDTSSPQAARESYLAQVRWAQDQRTRGALSAKELTDLLTPSHEAAETVIKAAQTEIENARHTRTQDITLEGNRLSAATQQFPNSFKLVDYALRWGPQGGDQASRILRSNVAMQQNMNANIRGHLLPATGAGAPGGAPAVPAGPPPPAAIASLAPPAPALPAGTGVTQTTDAGGVPRVRTPSGGPGSLSAPPPPVAPPPVAPPPVAPAPIGVTQTTDAGGVPRVLTPGGRTGVGAPLPAGMAPPGMPSAQGQMDEETYSQLPASVQQLYGRSILDQILSRYGG
jgi:hypothetical protein